LGSVFLKERPTPLQLARIGVILFGAYLFFDAPLSGSSSTGVPIPLLSALGGVAYLVSTGHLFLEKKADPLSFTCVTMALGPGPRRPLKPFRECPQYRLLVRQSVCGWEK